MITWFWREPTTDTSQNFRSRLNNSGNTTRDETHGYNTLSFGSNPWRGINHIASTKKFKQSKVHYNPKSKTQTVERAFLFLTCLVKCQQEWLETSKIVKAVRFCIQTEFLWKPQLNSDVPYYTKRSGYLFLTPEGIRLPAFLVLALVLVRCPRHGNPSLCLIPL